MRPRHTSAEGVPAGPPDIQEAASSSFTITDALKDLVDFKHPNFGKRGEPLCVKGYRWVWDMLMPQGRGGGTEASLAGICLLPMDLSLREEDPGVEARPSFHALS